jgi:hypothetical protein
MRELVWLIERAYSDRSFDRATALEKKRDALEVVLREEFRNHNGGGE